MVFGNQGVSLTKLQLQSQEALGKVREAIDFLVRGVRLLGSDVANSGRLFTRAALGECQWESGSRDTEGTGRGGRGETGAAGQGLVTEGYGGQGQVTEGRRHTEKIGIWHGRQPPYPSVLLPSSPLPLASLHVAPSCNPPHQPLLLPSSPPGLASLKVALSSLTCRLLSASAFPLLASHLGVTASCTLKPHLPFSSCTFAFSPSSPVLA